MNYLYRLVFNLEESMIRLNSFYFAPEVQKGLIEKRPQQDASSSEYSLTVQGNFSWGIASLDKEQKDKL